MATICLVIIPMLAYIRVIGATIPISDPFRLTPLLLAKAEIEKTERRHLLQTRPEPSTSSMQINIIAL
jgi:hypothetical protein